MLTWFLNLLGFKKKNIGKGISEDYEPITQELIDATPEDELYTKIMWSLLSDEVWFSDSQKAFSLIYELEKFVTEDLINTISIRRVRIGMKLKRLWN